MAPTFPEPPTEGAGDVDVSGNVAVCRPVLRLLGDGAHVRLPDGLLRGLDEITVEAWVRWAGMGYYAMVLSFGDTERSLGINNRDDRRTLQYYVYTGKSQLHLIQLPGFVRPDVWYHLAAVNGRGGMRLYVNGIEVGSHAFDQSFARIAPARANFLGRGPENWDNDTHWGELAEVRLWDHVRSPAQIRDGMDERLAAGRSGLIGLWDFGGGDARDLSGHGNHGVMVGHPETTEVAVGVPQSPAFLRGVARGVDGRPLPAATVRLHAPDLADVETACGDDGSFRLVVGPVPSAMVVSAAHGDLGVWQPCPALVPGSAVDVDLCLQPAVSIGGTVRALDGSPLDGVVVQAVDDDDEVRAATLSEQWGEYSFRNLRPDAYVVRVQIPGGRVLHDGGWLDVEPGREHEDVDFVTPAFRKGTWRSQTFLDGLVHDHVRALCQDADGALWVATAHGLSRWDGATWRNFLSRDGLPDTELTALCADRLGGLWISTRRQGLVHFDGQRFERRGEARLPSRHVTCLLATDAGLWVGTSVGIALFDGRHFTLFTPDDGLPHAEVLSLCEGEDGALWIGTGRWLSCLEGDTFRSFSAGRGLPPGRIDALIGDGRGGLWIGADTLHHFDGESFSDKSLDGYRRGKVTALARDSGGDLWIGSDRGLTRFDGSSFVNYSASDGLPHRAVRSLLTGRSPGIWIGTDGGLCRYDPDTMHTHGTVDGLPHPGVRALLRTADGTTWLGTGDGVVRYEDGLRLGEKEGLERTFTAVHHLLDAGSGCFWVAAQRGLYFYDGQHLHGYYELHLEHVVALTLDATGSLWVGTQTKGVFRYDEQIRRRESTTVLNYPYTWIGSTEVDLLGENAAVRDWTLFHTLPSNAVETILADADGTVWIATSSGLTRWRGPDDVDHYTTADGLPESSVRALHRDADGVLWIGTSGGLACMEGDGLRDLTGSDPLAASFVTAIHRGHAGLLCLGTSHSGLVLHDGCFWSSLDIRDGLPSNSVHAILEDGDGTLWIGTESGLVRYRRPPGGPRVGSLQVRGDRPRQDASAVPVVGVGVRTSFDFETTDLRTIAEKRRFHLRVRDGSGVAVVDKRLSTTTFDHVFDAPGSYTVDVVAADRDLNTSPPARLSVEVVAADVTLALHQTRQQLEDAYLRLELQNEELRRAKEEAESASAAKNLFLANVSHEIRTPLNAVMGYAQLLRRRPGLEEDIRRSLGTIYANGAHLLSLVNDVLDISRIEAGRVDLEESDFDLRGLLDEMNSIFLLNCRDKELDWSVRLAPMPEQQWVRGDESKLRQVLINLLSNAMKFTETGSVALSVTRDAAGATLFEVSDTGPGIEARDRERIFEPFSRGQRGARPREGTGLGLAIAARHVQVMGGELAVDSAPGEGSRFHFRVALPGVPSPSSGGTRVRMISDRTVRALVVDDVPENREVLTQLLRCVGVAVYEAADGQQALAAIAADRLDVVFLDIWMPGLDGMEVARRLRRADRAGPTLVAVTASVLEHERREYLEAGFDDVLSKPLDESALHACLERLLDIEVHVPTSAADKETPAVDLPAGLRRRLEEAARFGEITQLTAMLDEVRACGDAGAHLAEQIDLHCQRFDFDGLRRLLRESE